MLCRDVSSQFTPVHGCIAAQFVGGFGIKKIESLNLNMYVPQNSLNVTTCTHTFVTQKIFKIKNKARYKIVFPYFFV